MTPDFFNFGVLYSNLDCAPFVNFGYTLPYRPDDTAHYTYSVDRDLRCYWKTSKDTGKHTKLPWPPPENWRDYVSNVIG